ncbi:hypothetical protein GGI17_000925 [Coemansia sp. S146]|nr:hypothetical protein GGI17_000925 [Coemansia sp. S146]
MDSVTSDAWLGYKRAPSDADYNKSDYQPVPPIIPLLAAGNFSFSAISGNRYNSHVLRMQNILHHNCSAVRKLATPCDPVLRSMSGELARNIAADLETRLSRLAQGRKDIDPLDSWTIDVLEWIGCPESTASDDSQSNSDSEYSDGPKPYSNRADEIAPYFESLLLYIAHHVKACLGERVAIGPLKPEDYRLILPVANEDREAGVKNIYPSEYDYYKDFGYTDVERQAALIHHFIVAGTEVAAFKDRLEGAVQRLAAKTRTMFPNQHNRRFVWGLTASSRTIHAYVFGPDGIWASTEMDISGVEGCLAFISLLVDWSLCSVDRLGFDPTIRYIFSKSAGDTYLEIDVHEMDESTGQMEHHTYYSKRCVGAADRLFGCHARYFAASTSFETLNTTSFLIKDLWTTSSNGSADNTHESSFLTVLRNVLDSSTEFIDIGEAHSSRTLLPVFAGLPSIAQATAKDSGDVRQHRRTVTTWAGNMISAADNPSQVVVAIADAMTALNAAYAKCKLFHGDISNRAIQFQETADGIKGVLAGFDYAFYSGGSADATKADAGDDAPEMMLFQSIRALERLVEPEVRGMRSREYTWARSSRLDDWESILYIICVLGTFGINQAERNEYPAGESWFPHIKTWNSGNAVNAAEVKREHMDTERSFYVNIARKMVDGPLRRLAEDIHRVLFLDQRFPGTEISLEGRDPLALRDKFKGVIVVELLRVVERHKQVALVTLGIVGTTATSEAEPNPGPSKKCKRNVVLATLRNVE